VHYYFGTKEALADAVFAAAAAEFLPTVFAILGDADCRSRTRCVRSFAGSSTSTGRTHTSPATS
jgi:AcrR family transcriptional regulator